MVGAEGNTALFVRVRVGGKMRNISKFQTNPQLHPMGHKKVTIGHKNTKQYNTKKGPFTTKMNV
jgi:hypothetical protein